MDLPTCPSCKQSVLDDDAVECPFCGAPMKGGPAPARPPSQAAAPKPSAAKTATKSAPAQASAVKTAPTAGKPGRTAEKTPVPDADDDPFAVDQTAAAGAIPVSRQQTPGKSLEVTCPMCETKGFVSPKAAGKLIKCCNPECMVPIFTAPAIVKKEPVAPPPKPKKKLPWLYIVGGVAAAGIAVACIVIMNQPGTQELPPLVVVPVAGEKTSATDHEADEIAKGENGNAGNKNDEDKLNGKAGPPSAQNAIVKNALQRMIDVSFNIPNNRKSLWRRLASTAYIESGNLKQAAEQLDLLEKTVSQSPYEGVLPLVDLAWQKRAEPNEFKQAVDRAQKLTEKLPKRGRYATEAAIAAAPLLVISAKPAEARKLIADHRTEKDIEELAAALQVVIDDKTFDLDTTLTGRTVGDWQVPPSAAVTLILAAHGRWDDAFSWAAQAANPVAKSESAMICAESYARNAVPAEDAAGFERAAKAAEGLPPAGQSRLFARLAAVKFSKGDRAGAEELIAQAQSALAAVIPWPAIKVHGVKALLDLKLPDAVPLRQAALAAAEIAGVQTQLAQNEAAWSNVLLSVRYLNGIAPSASSIQERVKQLEGEPAKIRSELKTVLGLKKDDDIRQYFRRYQNKCQEVAKATNVRYFWLGVVFESAAEFGLLDQVWDELQVLDRKPVDEREPFLSTAVPMLVAAHFAAAGNESKKKEIYDAVASRINPGDPEIIKRVTEHMLSTGDISGCVKRLNEGMTAAGVLHEWTLRLACRLVKQGKINDAISFCNKIKDTALREDGLFLTAALAARLGRAEEFWKASSGMGAMEAAAACSGLVVGLENLPGK